MLNYNQAFTLSWFTLALNCMTAKQQLTLDLRSAIDCRVGVIDSGSCLITMDKAQNNNFDFLRQFAAFLVIFGHSESIVGTTHTDFWGVPISTLGIQIFFAVSGYLVSDSWLRQPKIGAFLKKRIRRIFPALIVCICISAFLLGPLLTRLSIDDYLTDLNTYNYLFNII